MRHKALGISAFQMTDAPALHAFFMKTRVTVAGLSNVLIKAPPTARILKAAHRLLAAKIAKMAVNTASARPQISVYGKTKLLHRKLTVGILGKILDQSLSPHRFISLFLHKKAYFLQFENHSQIIAQSLWFVKVLGEKKPFAFADRAEVTVCSRDDRRRRPLQGICFLCVRSAVVR